MTSRIAFQLGPLTIYWYGVFVALGFLGGMILMQYLARRQGYAAEKIPDIVVAALLGGLVGARLFFVVSNWDHFKQYPGEIIRIDHGGLVFYGGFFGAATALLVFCRIAKLDAWRIADLTAFGLPLGQAFGRIGCFINGCCFGKPTDSLLAITYHVPPHESVFQTQAEQHLINADMLVKLGKEGGGFVCLPVSPVQLYLALANLAILGLLLALLGRRRQWPPGLYFALFLALYAVARFSLEFLRGDYLHLHHGLTIAQVICLLLMPIALGLIWLRRPRRMAPA